MSKFGQELIEAMHELVDYSEGKISLRTTRLNVSPVCEISVGEPWDVGIVKSRIFEEKDDVLLFYSEQPIKVGMVKIKRFFGTPRHAEKMGVYNFSYIPDIEDYTISDITKYEKEPGRVKFLMIGSVKRL